MACKEIGQVAEKREIEWKIANFTSVAKDKNFHFYKSPTFSIEGVTYFLRLRPENRLNPEFACLYLASDDEEEWPVEYSFGLRNSKGKVKELLEKVDGDRSTKCANCIVFTDAQKFELAPHNILTIVCTLKPGATRSGELNIPGEMKPLIKLDKLSENFKDLFDDKESCDVTLKVQDKEYMAHRSVLMARSRVFAATFKHDTLERQTGIITIPDCDYDSFQQFLEYLYSGKLEDMSYLNALNLYYTSNKYEVEELKAFCIECLIQNLTVENMCEVLILAEEYDELKLLSAVQKFFNKNICKVFVNSEWESLMKKNYRLANKILVEMSKIKFGD